MGHTRIQIVAVAALISAGVGVTAVQASPNCERFVRTYVTVPVRNRVSKATALAWAKWRVQHPDWKPKPGVTRPKYLMSRKEALEKVELACEAPTTPTKTDLLFTPVDFDEPTPPAIDVPPIEITQMTFPGLIPPEVVEAPPFAGSPDTPTPETPGLFIPPYFPPVFGGGPGGDTSSPPTGTPVTTQVPPVVPPPIVAQTPEPASFVLVFFGMAAAGLFWKRRVRTAV